jgi:hypothetical protein
MFSFGVVIWYVLEYDELDFVDSLEEGEEFRFSQLLPRRIVD